MNTSTSCIDEEKKTTEILMADALSRVRECAHQKHCVLTKHDSLLHPQQAGFAGIEDFFVVLTSM